MNFVSDRAAPSLPPSEYTTSLDQVPDDRKQRSADESVTLVLGCNCCDCSVLSVRSEDPPAVLLRKQGEVESATIILQSTRSVTS
jgi:hypothetical protein